MSLISYLKYKWKYTCTQYIETTFLYCKLCRLGWACWFIIALDWILHDKCTLPALCFYSTRRGAFKVPLLEICLISLQTELIACSEFSRDENIEREMMLGRLKAGCYLWDAPLVITRWELDTCFLLRGENGQSVAHMLRASYRWHLMNPTDQ